MHFDSVDHAALAVTDLERSVKWYKEAMDFDVLHKWPKTDPRYGPVTTAWMVGKGIVRLGLFERPKATPVEHIHDKLVVSHVAYRTNAVGLLEAEARLEKLQISYGPIEDTGIAYSIFFNDPDNYSIEITTYYDPAFSGDPEVHELLKSRCG